LKIICYGDSNTYGYDPRSRYGERYPESVCWVDILRQKTGWNVINEGANGREIPTEVVCFPQDTDLLIVMLGTNDLLQLSFPDDAAVRMESFLNHLNLRKQNILLIAPPVMRPGTWVQDESLVEDSIALTQHYKELSLRCGVRFLNAEEWNIDLCFDGVHFSEEGSRVFAHRLTEYVLQIAPEISAINTECVSVDYMRRCDEETIRCTTSSRELMYRAAEGVYHAFRNNYGLWNGKVTILTGSGNNGGDGFALACILSQHPLVELVVYTLSDKLSEDSRYYAEMARASGVRVEHFDPESSRLMNSDIVVDCLLGTGFHGYPRESYRAAIDAINHCSAEIISVDINSGMNGDTGVGDIVVKSDLTVTIGFVKQGLLTDSAGNYMKRLACAEIGIDHLISRQAGDVKTAPCPDWFDAHKHFSCPMLNYTGTIKGLSGNLLCE